MSIYARTFWDTLPAGAGTGGSMTALHLNECHMYFYAPREASERYIQWRSQQPQGRVVDVGPPWAFTHVSIVCDDRAHAEWLRDWFVGLGIPKSALRIVEQRRVIHDGGTPVAEGVG